MANRIYHWQKKAKSKLLALEPRMLFDGAAAATAAPDMLPVPEPAPQKATEPVSEQAPEAVSESATPGSNGESDVANELESSPVSNELPDQTAEPTTRDLADKTGANSLVDTTLVDTTEDSQTDTVETLAQLREVSNGPGSEIVFIDTAINQHDALASAARDKGHEVFLIDANLDGIDQMAQHLEGRTDVDAIHILGHGGVGEQRIGATTLNAQTLAEHEASLKQIGSALSTDGDILLYGCHVASDDGKLFVDSLALITGADVAASDDPSGNLENGGDWVLEYDSGVIEARSLFEGETVVGFNEVLASPTINSSVTGLSTDEDVALSLESKISVASGAGTSNTMEAVITVTQGNGTLSSATGNDTVVGQSLASQGDLAAINTFLDGLGFIPDANWSGTATITLTVETDYTDGSSTDVSTLTFNVTVAPVSDAPEGTDTTLTITEDTAVTLSVADFGFSDPNDDPADEFVSVEITALPTTGTLKLAGNAVTAGQSISKGDIDAGNLVYTPADNDTTTQSLSFKVVDDGTDADDNGDVSNTALEANTLSFEVSKVNDAPVTTSPAALDTPKNTTLSGIDLTQYADDPDGGTGLDDAAIVEYVLGAVPDVSEGQLFVAGSATALGPNASLTPTEAANFVFVPTENYFSDVNNASFSFRAKDAAGFLSNESTVEIEVLGTNIAPVLTVPEAQTVAEETSLTISGIEVADADAGSGELELTLSALNGSLSFADTAGITVTDNGTDTVVVTGTVTALNTALGSSNLTYTPNENFPNGSVAATDTITVTVDDQGNSGDPSDAGFAIGVDQKTIAVTVTPVADPPEMTGDASLAAIDEDNQTSLGDSVANIVGGVFSNPDSDALAGIAITGNESDAQEGVWQYSADDGLNWVDVGTRSESSALLLSAAAKLRFVPAENYNGTPEPLSVFVLDDSGSRTFTAGGSEQTLDVTAAMAANDSDISVAGASITTSITPVDDPTITEPDTNTVLEDRIATGKVLTNDSDVDDDLTVASFTVNGVATNAGTTATINNFGTLVVNANGDYTFTPDANVSGKVPTITYTLNTGATSTLDITITPVNDPPELDVTGATVAIGGTLTFDDQIIDASDPDNTDAQLTFSFDSLPDRGYLTFDGDRVGPDTIVTYDQINKLELVDENGATDGGTSFDVTLRDGAGGSTTETIAISIGGGVNIAPDGIGDLTGTIYEDAGSYSGTIATNAGKLISEYTDYNFQDKNQAELNDGAAGFAIVGNTANSMNEGSWEYSTDGGTTWVDIGSPSDSTALMLSADTRVRFNPVTDYNGEPGALSIRGVDNTYTGLFSGGGSSVAIDVSGQLGGSNPVSNTVNTLTMTVEAVNDDPVLDSLNTATVPNGSRNVTIGSSSLKVSDVDSPPSSIRYTITDAPDIGQIRLDGYVLGVGSSFTQADIDSGRISYNASTGEGPRSDAVTFTVTDGAANVLLDRPGGIYDNGTLEPITFNIDIPNDVPPTTGGGTGGTGNSVPQVAVNTPVIGDEGAPNVDGDTIAITNSNLQVTDGDGDPISFTITSSPDNGTLLLSSISRPLVVGDTFTQADIDNGLLSFEHDGSENFLSSIGLSFTDGPAPSQSTTLAIDITPINDQPELSVQDAIIDEGKSFTPVISATDADGGGDKTGGVADTNTLTYTFSSPANGELRLVNDGMTYDAMDTSTYVVVTGVIQDADLNRPRYQHDNSETSSDSFVVTVNDNSGAGNATSSKTIDIVVRAVDDAPIVVKNTSAVGDVQFNTGGVEHNPKGPGYAQTSVMVDEGALVTITKDELQAYDPDSSAEQLQYRVTSVPSNGQLLLNVDGAGIEKALGVGSSFTQADIDAGWVTYQHDSSETATDSFGFKLTDAGGGLEPEGVFTIGINPVNDAPTITLPGPQTANEDQALAIRGVSIADADAGNSTVSVAFSVANGTLTLGSTSGLSFSAGDGSDDDAMTFTGSVSDINAALVGLRYLGDANRSGSDTLTIDVDDQGNTGKDPGLTGTSTSEAAQATLAITVNPVNDAPVITTPGAQTVNEDTNLTITGVSIADIDVADTAGGEIEVTLSVGEGVLTLAQTTGLSLATGDGTDTVTVKGSLASVNGAIATLTYRAGQDYFGADQLTIVASDLGNTGLGGVKTDTSVIDITVNPVNDAPTAQNLSVSATEDQVKRFSLTSGDVDSGTDPVNDAQVTQYQIISLPDPDKGVLQDSTGQTMLVGKLISVAQATNMRFVPTANANGVASFDFKAVDQAGARSDQRTVTINIAAVNDAPVISGGGDTVSYTEGDGAGAAGTPVILNTAGDLQISDQELIIEGIDDFDGATLTVQRASANADDVFGFAGSSVSTSGSDVLVSSTTVGTYALVSGQLTVTLNSAANQSAVESVMRSLTYANTADDLNGEIAVPLWFRDGNSGAQGSGGDLASNVATFTVNVINTNDAPTLDSAMTLAAVEDTTTADATGTAISAIVGESFSDLDASDSLGGIVITDDDADRATEGFWQYSTDGTNWHDVSPVGATALSTTNALVLSADAELRFVPVADFNSRLNQTTVNPGALSVLAIDDSNNGRVFTTGSTGVFIDVSVISDPTSDIGWASTAKTITAEVAQVNDAPVINNLDTLGNTFLSFTEAAGVNIAGSAVLLDTGTPATITDTDLTDREETTFNGARLVIQNKDTIDTDDLFVLQTGDGVGINGGFTLPGSGIRLFNNDSNITYGNQTVAKLTDNSSTSGQLIITFNDKADSAAINAIVTNIAYSNRNDSLSTVTDKTITVEFFDGNGTQPDNQQGTGGELSDVAEIQIKITPTNDAPLLADNLVIQGAEADDGVSTPPDVPATIDTLLGGLFVDPDNVPNNVLAGIAVSGFDDKGVGRWEVSFDSGSNWSALSSLQPGGSEVSDTNALLLSATIQIRFVQDAQANTEGGDSARPSLSVFSIETDALDNSAANAPAIASFSGSPTSLVSINTTADTAESRLAETASQVFVAITPVNDAPVINGLDAVSVNATDAAPYVQGGDAVVIDPDATVFDQELSVERDDWSGATLTIQRQGGASADDVFGYSGTSSSGLYFDGNDVKVDGTTVGSLANSGRVLTITFTSSAATASAVNTVLQGITYSNAVTAAGGLSYDAVTLDVTINDQNSNTTGGGTAGTTTDKQDQGTGGALSATERIEININRLPVTVADANTVDEGLTTSDSSVTSGNVLTGVGNTNGAGADSDPDVVSPDRADVLVVVGAKTDSAASFVAVGSSSTSVTGNYGTLVIGADGSYDYTLDNTDTAVQALALDESLTDAFDYRVGDGLDGFNTASLTVTINGTNDAPVISLQAGDADTGSVTETNAVVTVSDTLTVNDVDATDKVSSSVESVSVIGGTFVGASPLSNDDIKAMLTLTAGSINADAVDINNLAWTFDSGSDTAFDFLAKGETLEFTYTVKVTDDSGATSDNTDTHSIVVTVTGTNDTPDITAIDVTGKVIEDVTTGSNGAVDLLQDNGSLAFADVDLSDKSLVTAAYVGTTTGGGASVSADLATALQAAGAFVISGDGVGTAANSGTVNWAFELDNSLTQYLAHGETVTVTYRVTVTDDSGVNPASGDNEIDARTQDVTITIVGTNDTPDIRVESGDTARVALTEPTTPTVLKSDGTLTVTDVDLTDKVSAAVIGVTTGGTFDGVVEPGQPSVPSDNDLLSMFTVTNTALGADPTDVNNLNWTFDSGSVGVFDFLAEGETLILTYTIEVTDDSGATTGESRTDTETVTITITGTNSAATFGNPDAVSKTETDKQLVASGQLTVNDSDLSDADDVSVIGVTLGSGTTFAGINPLDNTTLENMLTIGAGTVVGTSQKTFDWTFESGQSGDGAFDFLREGEVLELVYTVEAKDGSTSDITTVTVTITGTNDKPQISLASDDSDRAQLTETDGVLNKTGTLTARDVDLADTVEASVEAVTIGGTFGESLPSLDFKGMLSVAMSPNSANPNETNNLDWTFNSGAADAFDFLAKDETLQLDYTVKVTDDSGAIGGEATTDVHTVLITIVGTNDTPEITAGINDFGFAEADNASSQSLNKTGTLAFTDVDVTDEVSVTSEVMSAAVWSDGTLDFDLKQALEAGLTIGDTGLSAPGSVNWDYTVSNVNLDFLSAGETIALTYRVSVTDDSGVNPASGNNEVDTTFQDVTITITGTNDAPVITEAIADFAFTESDDASAQDLSQSGTLAFDDMDVDDVIDVTSTLKTPALWSGGTLDSSLKSALEAGLSIGGTDVAVPGSVNWTYTVNAADLDFLSAGETVTLTYTFSVTDSQGASDTDDVTITINGSNDAPVITLGVGDSAAATLNETDTGLSTSGTLSVADLDLTDKVTASVQNLTKSGITAGLALSDQDLASYLTLAVADVIDGTATEGKIGWAFDSGNEAFDYLAVGESLVLTYTVRATDSQDASAEQDVVITIVGTNDAPVITEAIDDIAFTELVDASAQDLSKSGTLRFDDIDATDVVDVTGELISAAVWSDGELDADLKAALEAGLSIGGNAVAAPGSVDWTYEVANADLDFLAAGETITLSYRVSVTDSQGASATDDMTVTITGTNDAPVATSEQAALVGEVIERSNAGPGVDQASGQLTAAELDINDSVRWSLTGFVDSKYGDLRIDPLTGVWVYQLDNTRDATVRLAQGQTAQVQYVVRATDQFGASVDQIVTLTIVGRDDVLPPSVFESSDSTDEETLVVSSRAGGGVGGDGRLPPLVVPEPPSRLQLGPSVDFLPQPLEASRMPLRNTIVPPDVVPELGGSVVFQLPEGTFDGGDGVIWLYATLRDGTPLPEWIRFDGATGRIEADVPADLTEPLEIRVQARDAHGETAETVFKILPRGEDLGFTGKPSLTAQFQQMMD